VHRKFDTFHAKHGIKRELQSGGRESTRQRGRKKRECSERTRLLLGKEGEVGGKMPTSVRRLMGRKKRSHLQNMKMSGKERRNIGGRGIPKITGSHHVMLKGGYGMEESEHFQYTSSRKDRGMCSKLPIPSQERRRENPKRCDRNQRQTQGQGEKKKEQFCAKLSRCGPSISQQIKGEKWKERKGAGGAKPYMVGVSKE